MHYIYFLIFWYYTDIVKTNNFVFKDAMKTSNIKVFILLF